MKNLNNKITDITIGIRFQRSFKVKDVLGAITDKLLHDENSPFSTDFFPKINQDISEVILLNENGAYLRVNTDDIIFKHIVTNEIDEELKFLDEYLKYIKNIIKKYNITGINRIGIIYNHKIKNDQKKIISAISDITNNQFNDVDDFSLSFSKKLPETSGLIKKGVNDYKNVIYLFRKISKTELAIGLDYQKYFLPPLDDIKDKNLEDFITNSKQYLENTFYTNFLE